MCQKLCVIDERYRDKQDVVSIWGRILLVITESLEGRYKDNNNNNTYCFQCCNFLF